MLLVILVDEMSSQKKPSILPLPAHSRCRAFEPGSCRPSEGRSSGSWDSFLGPLGWNPPFPVQVEARGSAQRLLFSPPACSAVCLLAPLRRRGWGNLISQKEEAVSPRCEHSLIPPSLPPLGVLLRCPARRRSRKEPRLKYLKVAINQGDAPSP